MKENLDVVEVKVEVEHVTGETELSSEQSIRILKKVVVEVEVEDVAGETELYYELRMMILVE